MGEWKKCVCEWCFFQVCEVVLSVLVLYLTVTPSFSSTRTPFSWYSSRVSQKLSLSFMMSASTAPPRNTMCFRLGGSSIRILNFYEMEEHRGIIKSSQGNSMSPRWRPSCFFHQDDLDLSSTSNSFSAALKVMFLLPESQNMYKQHIQLDGVFKLSVLKDGRQFWFLYLQISHFI